MKYIELTKGYHAIVDNEDFELVSLFKVNMLCSITYNSLFKISNCIIMRDNKGKTPRNAEVQLGTQTKKGRALKEVNIGNEHCLNLPLTTLRSTMGTILTKYRGEIDSLASLFHGFMPYSVKTLMSTCNE